MKATTKIGQYEVSFSMEGNLITSVRVNGETILEMLSLDEFTSLTEKDIAEIIAL